ncbi:amidohydrolase family protein [Steroidobacter sp. S1-65]|uniref:Amidohydrolase family protein n=1 Tax=Steroidobacter gossypii TaxID=2805490 RepID=A0ABS1X4W1_9GAMM|nr:amidohydrolase family protein [Steroidobacter gossypii]MBM0108266.1 amidohydrolase family protein [Steroidobacter gossypii]
MRTLIASLLVICASNAVAQDVLIRGATVHTASSKGTLTNTDVLIRDGKIHSVGSGLSADGAVSIDAKGRALTPGMFAGLSTIGVEEVSQEETANDAALSLGAPAYEMQWRPEFDVSTAYNSRSVVVPVTRIEGMTWTVLAPGTARGSNFLAGQGAAVTLDGRRDAVLDGSRSLFINLGGKLNSLSGGSRAAQWMLLEQAVHETRNRISDDKALMHPLGREVFGRYLAGGRVVFHVDRANDIVKTVSLAKRYGIKPVIAGGAEAWVVAEELAEAKVPVILDPLANLPSSFDQIGARLDNAALLHRAGVKITFSQFEDSHNARKVRQTAGNAVAHGMPKEAAITALTADAADIFGLGASRGRIAPGQAADLVLWSGDPLDVTSVAEQVWIAGKAIEMRSRQLELRDRYFQRLKQVTSK